MSAMSQPFSENPGGYKVREELSSAVAAFPVHRTRSPMPCRNIIRGPPNRKKFLSKKPAPNTWRMLAMQNTSAYLQ